MYRSFWRLLSPSCELNIFFGEYATLLYVNYKVHTSSSFVNEFKIDYENKMATSKRINESNNMKKENIHSSVTKMKELDENVLDIDTLRHFSIPKIKKSNSGE